MNVKEKDFSDIMNDFNFNKVFRSYTSSHVSLNRWIKGDDTSKKRKLRKERARQLTKMNMEKKKKK